MGVGKGNNVEVVNIDDLFLLFLSINTAPGESTAAAIPAFSLNIDSDSPPVSHATREFYSLIPTTASLSYTSYSN